MRTVALAQAKSETGESDLSACTPICSALRKKVRLKEGQECAALEGRHNVGAYEHCLGYAATPRNAKALRGTLTGEILGAGGEMRQWWRTC